MAISMIKSFAHKGLKRFFETSDTRGIQANHAKRLRLLLSLLDRAKTIDDIASFPVGLHPLKHNLAEYWSIKVSGNWRLIFKFEDNNVYLIDYLDYH